MVRPGEQTPMSAVTGTPREVQEVLATYPSDPDTQVLAITLGHADAETVEIFANKLTRTFRVLLEKSETPEQRELLAQWMAGLPEPTTLAPPHLLREAAMRTRARKAVLASGDWLTAGQIAEIAGLSATNPSAQPNKWKRKGLIFAIHYKGADLFPAYGLDPDTDYRPRKALADIIRVFAGHKRGWGMAFWFMSDNSFLGGQRPQDVLATDPAKVIAAAEDEIQPISHG